jgi:uncharacterized protein with HEPN domain
MTPREVRSVSLRIQDMLDAMAGIRQAIAGDAIDTVAADWIRQRAVECGFEIISEASRHIPPELKRSEPATRWDKIAGLGNILRHDYADVSLPLLLRVAEDEFPALEAALRRMLASV